MPLILTTLSLSGWTSWGNVRRTCRKQRCPQTAQVRQTQPRSYETEVRNAAVEFMGKHVFGELRSGRASLRVCSNELDRLIEALGGMVDDALRTGAAGRLQNAGEAGATMPQSFKGGIKVCVDRGPMIPFISVPVSASWSVSCHE
jgi:hypothetical protein